MLELMPENEEVGMGQFSFRVRDELGEAFKDFCEDQGIKPYQLLEAIVSFYGRSRLVTQRMKNNTITKDEAFVELGKIMSDAKQFVKANGEFKRAMDQLLKPYGLNTKAFGLT